MILLNPSSRKKPIANHRCLNCLLFGHYTYSCRAETQYFLNGGQSSIAEMASKNSNGQINSYNNRNRQNNNIMNNNMNMINMNNINNNPIYNKENLNILSCSSYANKQNQNMDDIQKQQNGSFEHMSNHQILQKMQQMQQMSADVLKLANLHDTSIDAIESELTHDLIKDTIEPQSSNSLDTPPNLSNDLSSNAQCTNIPIQNNHTENKENISLLNSPSKQNNINQQPHQQITEEVQKQQQVETFENIIEDQTLEKVQQNNLVEEIKTENYQNTSIIEATESQLIQEVPNEPIEIEVEENLENLEQSKINIQEQETEMQQEIQI